MTTSRVRKACRRLEVNLKFLILKTIASLLRNIPCPVLFLRMLGGFFGLVSMMLQWRQWKIIAAFAEYTCSPIPLPSYLLRYYLQKGRDQIWELLFFETQPLLDSFVTIENEKLANQALGKGRGMIILGAHYGPTLYTVVLSRISDRVKALMHHTAFTYWKETAELGIEGLKSKMLLYLSSHERTLLTGKSERELILHLRQGGVLYTDIDFPGPRTAERSIDFLDLPISPHYFPFRLASKYEIPVFFCIFTKNGSRGYRLHLVPAEKFAQPEEGFERYISFIEEQILCCPFMWGFLPHFMEWVSSGSLSRDSQIAKPRLRRKFT